MAKFVAGSLNLISVLPFSSFKRDYFFYVPLGSTSVSPLRPRLSHILGNCGHARSQGGRQPGAAKTPCITYIILEVPGRYDLILVKYHSVASMPGGSCSSALCPLSPWQAFGFLSFCRIRYGIQVLYGVLIYQVSLMDYEVLVFYVCLQTITCSIPA